MTAQTQALRALVNGGQPFIAADYYSAPTARIVERAGFEVADMGGSFNGPLLSITDMRARIIAALKED